MQNYRFSPIEDKNKLLEAINYIHVGCHELSMSSFGIYLPIVGSIGVFCHDDDEYERLLAIQKEMVDQSDDYDGKYFRLHEPIIIPKTDDVPAAVYTHLYIGKPDQSRAQVGELDFYMPPAEYEKLKQSLLDGKELKGLQIDQSDTNMVDLYDPDNDTSAHISPTTL
jgi:hypothetical protein